MKHLFDSTIIRSYDIRGIYQQTLDKNDARALGHLLAISLEKNKVVNIGYDGRFSSIPLKNELISGLVEGGAVVNDIGLGPTPMLYYSCYLNNSEMGVMVTGSHNPSNHNGFKIVKNNRPLFGKNLKNLAEKGIDYELGQVSGSSHLYKVKEKYTQKLISYLTKKRKLNICWDSGNGAAGEVMSYISKKVLGKHILLFDDIDGNFPNHHPDPSDPKNLQDIIECVKENSLDIGIAFDGDGDRIGVVDDKGRVVPGDILLLVFAKDLLEKEKNCSIIGDVKCSKILFDYIKKNGGRPIMAKTGHSHIKECIKENDAELAGEMSGHIFFADNYFGFDDALYAAVRLINILSKSEKKLSDIIDEFPKSYNTPEIRIECDDKEKFKIIDKVIKNQKNKKYSDIDGIRVELENGWWLMRASNTQAAMVLRCEANSKKDLDEIISIVKNEIKKISPELSKQILA